MEFEHTQHSDEHLRERLGELAALQEFPHGEERVQQIAHELSCVVFELIQRQ